MNEQNIHPLIRYGGPVLGAIILYFVLSAMIGGFQAEQTAIRRAALGPATAVEENGEVADPAAMDADLAEESAAEEPAVEEPAVEEPAVEEPAVEEPAVEEPSVEDLAVEEPVDPEPVDEPEEDVEEPVVETTEATPVALQVATVEVTPTVEATAVPATPTAAPSTLAEMTPEQIYADLPAEIAAFFPDQADPRAGEQLVLTSGCTACHSLQPGVVQVGPSWYGAGDHAVTRVPGLSPALYLYISIVRPNEHLVEGFQPNLMPQIYDQTLTDEQIANMVAYLLTLRE